MVVSLIIFDLDGTLADTAIDTRDALNEAIRPFTTLSFSVNEAKAAMGGAEDGVMEKLHRETGLDWMSFRDRFSAAYTAHLTVRTKLYPGVRQTLDRLSCLRKVVFSNKREDLTVKILAHFQLLPYFEAVVGGDSGGGRKPSPNPILHVLSRAHARPEETLLVGDCIYDVDAGRAAGVRTVAVTYGYGVVGFAEKADFVIDAMPQLVDVVEELKTK
jgi:phosphoglycolate phosphatase